MSSTLSAPPSASARPLTILLFAGPREALGGASSVTLPLAPPLSVARLRAALAAAHAQTPLASLLPACRFAVGQELVAPEDEAVRLVDAAGGEEVALIAPVGGG